MVVRVFVMFFGLRLGFIFLEMCRSFQVVWARRMGVGCMVRMMDSAKSSFLWGRFWVAVWVSFESCRSSSELPYS